MGQAVIQRTFAGGELAPVLHSRADQVRYQTGLRKCLNWIIRKEGGATNRAGLRFVGALKTATAGARLMAYVDSTPGQSYVIEVGQGYFRFVRHGGYVRVSGVPAYDAMTDYVVGDLVAVAGVNYYCHTAAAAGNAPPDVNFWYALAGDLYEIPTPYDLSKLPRWNQSGNVLTLTHDELAPRELVFLGMTRWVLRAVSTVPQIGQPTTVVATPGQAGLKNVRYIVTAADKTTGEESGPSGIATCALCELGTLDKPNVLGWDANPAAGEFFVYSDGGYGNDAFGFIGSTTSNAFNDAGVTPDFNVGPPVTRVMFDTAAEYPRVSVHHGQRRYYGNTQNNPDAVYGSKIAFPWNMSVSVPVQDDDAITFRLAGNNYQAVLWMLSLKAGLLLCTGGGEWTLTGGGGPRNPITPSSLDGEQETYSGVSDLVKPLVVGQRVVYLQARNNCVREVAFTQEVEGLAGRDLSIWSSHLFEQRHTIRASAYQQVPHSVVWCVRDDGVLLGMTYVPEQEVWGWHQHTTAGAIEDVVCVPEHDEDVVYVIVKRTVAGVEQRYLERLERREIRDGYTHHDSFFVDSGLTFEAPAGPQTVISGLDHLAGELVSVLGDGVVHFDANKANPTAAERARYTVSAGGAITLATAVSIAHVGLPYVSDLETLDLDVEGASIRDKKKRVGSIDILLERSSRAVLCGPDTAHLREFVPEKWQSTTALYSGQIEQRLTSEWSKGGRVLVRQSAPLPATVIGLLPNVDLGGA